MLVKYTVSEFLSAKGSFSSIEIVGKRPLKSAEIRTYIKGRNAPKIEPKTIHNEICKIYGDNYISYRLINNLIRKFSCGIDSVQDVSRSGRPRTAVTPKNMSK